ncbi:MAG: ACP S-malonyltransferase [Alphaproteobacteria bacterium]
MKAFVFPGQGSQKIGMGKEMAENFTSARMVFEEVNDALSFDLYELMTQGDAAELNKTANTQPALMATSLAALRALEEASGQKIEELAHMVAGHSLGEYSALAAVDAISVGDAAKLLRLRGQAMQRAVSEGVGAMAVVLGLNFDDVDAIAKEATLIMDNIVVAANDNADGQVVLSGYKAAVEKAGELAKERGAKRVLPLPVSVPSHSPLMSPAFNEMKEALAEITFKPLKLPLIANVTAQKVEDIADMPDLLVQQLVDTVRWRESVQYMASQDIDCLVEIGSGKVLSGLTRRINQDLASANIENPTDIDKFLNG